MEGCNAFLLLKRREDDTGLRPVRPLLCCKFTLRPRMGRMQACLAPGQPLGGMACQHADPAGRLQMDGRAAQAAATWLKASGAQSMPYPGSRAALHVPDSPGEELGRPWACPSRAIRHMERCSASCGYSTVFCRSGGLPLFVALCGCAAQATQAQELLVPPLVLKAHRNAMGEQILKFLLHVGDAGISNDFTRCEGPQGGKSRGCGA